MTRRQIEKINGVHQGKKMLVSLMESDSMYYISVTVETGDQHWLTGMKCFGPSDAVLDLWLEKQEQEDGLFRLGMDIIEECIEAGVAL